MAVPPDDGSELNDRQGLCPVSPHLAQGDPEEAVARDQPWAAASVSQGGELLAEGEILEHERTT